ncbi:MAG: hypothetical protein Q9224_005100, partial [Gallowayella concinna]
MLSLFLLTTSLTRLALGQRVVTITTNITHDRSQLTFDNNNEEAVRAFRAALPLSETNVDDKDVELFATRLVKYDGCDNFQANQIYSGWQQSWKIMEASKNGDIDFNSAAALEFLGASGLNKDKHDAMNSQKNMYAYTSNKDVDSGLARINFCPKYFQPQTSTLPSIIKFMKKETLKSFKFDIDQYSASQAHVWIHELLHIDWVSQAKSYGSNEHVTDLKINFFQPGDKWAKEVKAYGGKSTKILARFPENTGKYVMKNADNLALYALAHYVQGQIDGYPLYPLVNNVPSADPHLFTTKDGK